jgi:threonine dehydrogenase-like Zn-dependent dehydrogenase
MEKRPHLAAERRSRAGQPVDLSAETALVLGIGGCRYMRTAHRETVGSPSPGHVGSDEKLARARDLGADGGFNYKTTDWVQQVREATEGRGPDLIIDGTGGATFDEALHAVRPGGRTGSHIRRHDWTGPAADGEAYLLETARRPRIHDGCS